MVNRVQIKELSEIMDVLDEVLDDPQKRYYVVIDRLDENWIEDRLRYLLIRALIETVRDFRKVRHAKIVVALRVDLIDRVFRMTRDAGFQEEKYQSLYVDLTWTRERLVEVMDTRIDRLVAQRYSKQKVTHRDLLPRQIDGDAAIDYILDRTMLRPRDIILFFNECIARAVDSPRISASLIKEAEGDYSRRRLRSLADEWFADYPNFLRMTALLKGRRPHLGVDEISLRVCEELALGFIDDDFEPQDEFSVSARQVVEEVITSGEFRRIAIQTFYRMGVVGLKFEHMKGLSGRAARGVR